MATANTVKKPRTRSAKKREQMAADMAGLRLAGFVVTWNAQGPHPFAAVKQALTDAGLDPEVARDMGPGPAFTRACKSLEEGRLIDVIRSDADEALFQFTKSVVVEDTADADQQLEYHKEAKVKLNKRSGKVVCKDPALQARAQELLDKAVDQRTTSDITGMVQRLFTAHADLIRLREQGAVYFVAAQYEPFLLQVETFLTKLGGRLNRLPVPKGTQYGDEAITDAMEKHFQDLIADYNAAVEGFTLHTRPDTIQAAVDKINTSCVKLEAYASYLGDKKEGLGKALDAANAKLVAQVDKLTEDRKNLPPEERENLGYDEFKCRQGTIRSRINAQLTDQPKTAEEIAKVIGLPAGRVHAILGNAIKRGLPFLKTKEGYRLNK